MSLALSLGVAVGAAPAAAVGAVNPNLLLWTEELQQATWTKTLATVTANAATDPLGGSTADQIANAGASSIVAQVSTVSAATGAASYLAIPTAAWTRFSATGTFDVGTYTFSIWLLDQGGSGSDYRLQMDVSGGFIRCYLRDMGDSLTVLAWGAKLEAGSSPTGDATNYGKREGV